MTTQVLPIMQLLLTTMNICVLLYAFVNFLKKPKNDLDERIKTLEVKVEEHGRRLDRGNIKFDTHDKTNEVLIRSTLALVEFEIQYCISEKKPMSRDLEKARDDLHNYLARK